MNNNFLTDIYLGQITAPTAVDGNHTETNFSDLIADDPFAILGTEIPTIAQPPKTDQIPQLGSTLSYLVSTHDGTDGIPISTRLDPIPPQTPGLNLKPVQSAPTTLDASGGTIIPKAIPLPTSGEHPEASKLPTNMEVSNTASEAAKIITTQSGQDLNTPMLQMYGPIPITSARGNGLAHPPAEVATHHPVTAQIIPAPNRQQPNARVGPLGIERTAPKTEGLPNPEIPITRVEALRRSNEMGTAAPGAGVVSAKPAAWGTQLSPPIASNLLDKANPFHGAVMPTAPTASIDNAAALLSKPEPTLKSAQQVTHPPTKLATFLSSGDISAHAGFSTLPRDPEPVPLGTPVHPVGQVKAAQAVLTSPVGVPAKPLATLNPGFPDMKDFPNTTISDGPPPTSDIIHPIPPPAHPSVPVVNTTAPTTEQVKSDDFTAAIPQVEVPQLGRDWPSTQSQTIGAPIVPGSSDLGVRVTHAIAQAALSLQDRPVELIFNPEELGRVRLTLQSGEGSMSVTVTVERPDTMELLRRYIDLLADQLREIGYRNLSFDFARDGDGAANQQGYDPQETDPGRIHDDLDSRPPSDRTLLTIDPNAAVDIRL